MAFLSHKGTANPFFSSFSYLQARLLAFRIVHSITICYDNNYSKKINKCVFLFCVQIFKGNQFPFFFSITFISGKRADKSLKNKPGISPIFISMPTLYIIAGPNGAGKTTASYTLLPDMLDCREFVNADEIARGLSPFNPESMAFEAGRIMLQRIEQLVKSKSTFAFETTLSTRSYTDLVSRCQLAGYHVVLIFLWLNSPELAIERVKSRVAKGGHNIPEDVIRRRYERGLKNFVDLFLPICDEWLMADNSADLPQPVAKGEKQKVIQIHQLSIWEQINLYGKK
jgi:predicted ABC-type ATPase